MWEAVFPVFFLVFMIPLPDGAVVAMEQGLMVASAEASDWLFNLSGTPVFRDGQAFHLPGFSLQVAQECSGIRSSWVLLMTSLLAAYLFLHSRWRQTLLVAVVIPLGILRNGFRILVIGLLCVHSGPHMIDSWIHHHGGPFFFGLSLIPFFLLLWWLRRSEHRPAGSEASASAESTAEESAP
jgi:exosortase C (VPDSG-CTERM-specific)